MYHKRSSFQFDFKIFKSRYRDWVNKNSGLTTIVAIAGLALALIAIAFQLHRPTPVFKMGNAYFYDMDTDKVFVSSAGDIPPINVPGSTGAKPMGARAMVFACHDCKDEKDRFVGWVEVYTPETKAKLEDVSHQSRGAASPITPQRMMMMGGGDGGHLLAKPDPANPQWKNGFVDFTADEGSKVMLDAQQRCGEGTVPQMCQPLAPKP
jgi:hypothetical protein